MRTWTRRRRTPITIVVLAVAAFGLAAPPGHADEDDGSVPGSCRLHPTHVVNPGCVPALAEDVREPGITLPNLSPDVRTVAVQRPWILDEETQTYFQGSRVLAFDSWVQNLGDVPLELVADDPQNPTTALQCVSWTGHVCREKRVVGEYVWHEEHAHFHFTDFADYQLRKLTPEGRPDYSADGLLAISEKVSFCLVDGSLIDVLDPAPPFYLSCGPTLQGVSPKWADVYGTGTQGQNLPIEEFGDGRYALIVTMDYANRLYESDDTDNVVELTVEVSGDMTQATIVDKHRP
jgi:Lysyl oxidase